MKPLIIAGNGPSIKDLDYSLFPSDFDVFRCNQFYFEDKYYLGREVKGVFFNPSVFDAQIEMARVMQKRFEYNLDDVYCTNIGTHSWFNKVSYVSTQEYLDKYYIGIRSVYGYLKDLEPFFALHSKYSNFYGQHFTTGIMMLIVAIALGYKEIYLCGIDFYEQGVGHYYENKGDFFKELPDLSHSKSIDIEGIELAKKYADLYALVPNSSLTRILPCASKNGVSLEVQERLCLGKAKSKDFKYSFKIEQSPFYTPPPPPQKFKSLLKKDLKKRGVNEKNLIFFLLRDSYHFLRGVLALLCVLKP
ncbi:alpha-2,3-sialyltransferase [Helicobacter cetorum]|uniref:alpha-2,3-sialyltransferase n=1 Tax=Helicobacter cetorum TaxID=138563 RepID=UPI000CF12859|nr:alpha-2,3-sialyltransferase [Helicobacter cetorum]